METYINTCNMCKKSLKQSLLGWHQCWMMNRCHKISSGRMALHDLWESGKSQCMTALFFRADSSSLEAGSLNTVCLTVAPICLNTKNCKKEKK